MKNSNPEKFLDTQELSALESQSILGGQSIVDEDGRKKKIEKRVEV
jgi:hypothetical protein